MVNDLSLSDAHEKAAYIKLFDALAGHNLLLEANPPFFTIIAATSQRLQDVGMTKEAMIGKPLFEAHPGNSSDPSDNGVSNLRFSLDYVLRYKKIHQLPVQRYDLPDGRGGFSEKYWRASNQPVLNEEDEVAYIIHTAEDITLEITAHKQEERLKFTEKAYNLFMQVPFAIHIFTGPELIIDLANPLTLELWGRDEDIIGKRFLDVLPELKGQGYDLMMQDVMATGKPRHFYEVELVLNRPGKEPTGYFNFIYQPYYKEGSARAESILIIASEVTQQVLARRQASKSEQSLSLAVEIAELGVFTIDLKTSSATYSQKVMDWFGFDQPSLAMTEIFSKIHSEDQAMATEIIERSIAGEWDGRHDFVYRILHPKTGIVQYLRSVGQVLFEESIPVRLSGIIQDITEQVASRRWLEESEERFRNLIYSSPFAIGILKGPDLVITAGNDAIIEIWGKGKEIIGQSYFTALPELAEQGYKEVFNDVYTTAKAANFVETPVHILQDGAMTLKYYNFILYPQRNERGEVDGIGIIASEVTPQALLNKKIKESEERFNNLIREATVGIVVLTGEELKVAVVNKAYGRLIGRSEEELLDKNLFDLIPEAEAYFRPLVDGVRLSGKPVYLYDTPYAVSTNGQKFEGYLNVVYQPYREVDGTLTGVMALCQNVTEQVASRLKIKESEERFRHLADDSPMFVFIIDPDPLATVSYWNETWLEYTGQTLDEGLGRAWDGMIHADDIPVVMKYYGSAFQNREPYLIPAVRVKRHDGAYRWHTFKGNPRYLPNGDFNGYVGVGFDIHDQKITEENLEELVAQRTQELQRINTELKRSNAHLEEFAHAASHDLKEPVRKIHYFTQHLKEQLGTHLKEVETRSFSRIENATERMGSLIDDLLLYSHVSQRPHEKESVNLNQKVQRVLEDLELDIEEKSAAIRVDSLPVVKGYPRQLQQLFQNLISNAVKYSKADVAPLICIRANEVIENSQPYYVIEIQDNGIGFAPEYADKIFQMFTRLHGKAEYSGTGVGLSIVKKVVENHDGFVRVKSIPNQGSTFSILLPAE